jgi:hypothetical protein
MCVLQQGLAAESLYWKVGHAVAKNDDMLHCDKVCFLIQVQKYKEIPKPATFWCNFIINDTKKRISDHAVFMFFLS